MNFQVYDVLYTIQTEIMIKQYIMKKYLIFWMSCCYFNFRYAHIFNNIFLMNCLIV